MLKNQRQSSRSLKWLGISAPSESSRSRLRALYISGRFALRNYEFRFVQGAFGLIAIAAALAIMNSSQIRDAIVRMFELGRIGGVQILFCAQLAVLFVGCLACLVRRRATHKDQNARSVYVAWSIMLYAIMLTSFFIDPLSAAEFFVAPLSILIFINTFPALLLAGDALKQGRLGMVPMIFWLAACFFAFLFPNQEEVANLITSSDSDGVQRVSSFMERENKLVLENRRSFQGAQLDTEAKTISSASDFCTVANMLAIYGAPSLQVAYERAQGGGWKNGRTRTTSDQLNEDCLEYLAAFERENSSGRHPEVRESFRAWLGVRPDKGYYDQRGRKYPVFLVTAQGGGIYAAAHASLFLAEIQTLCPSFADHLFAISGVSGGSVGSAVFASALATQPQIRRDRPFCPLESEEEEPSPLMEQTTAFLKADHLSVLIGALVTTDLWSDLLPFLPQRKRGDAILASFEASLKPDAKTYWRKGVAGAWSPDQSVPALLFNTTEVDLGRRLVVAPFSSRTMTEPDFPFFSRHLGDQYFIDENNYKRGLTIGSAALASARFPFVTGSLTIPMGIDLTPDDHSDNIAVQLVDGGYYDNSGGETLEELVRVLDTRFGEQVEFFVIAFAGTDQDRALTPLHPAWEASRQEPSDMYFTNLRHNNVPWSDALSPGQTFISSRAFRGQLALERLNTLVSGNCLAAFSTDCIVRKNFLRFTLDDRKLELPLGWTLSDRKLQTIFAQRPDASQCGVTLIEGGYEMDDTMREIGMSRSSRVMWPALWGLRLPKDRAMDEEVRLTENRKNLIPEEFKMIFEGVAGRDGSSDCALISLHEILMDTYVSDPQEAEQNRQALERIYVERWFGNTGPRILISN